MSILMKSSLSPQHLKLIVIGAGLLGLWTIWGMVQSKVGDLRHQPIYGEQGPSTEQALREELYSLPIVVSRSDASSQSELVMNDAAIEAAFREPVVEISEEESDKEPAKVTLTQQFIVRYRPVVNAVSNNGAVINGQFWSIGEGIASLPLHTSAGEVVIPRLRAVSAKHVVMTLGDESVSLDFDRN